MGSLITHDQIRLWLFASWRLVTASSVVTGVLLLGMATSTTIAIFVTLPKIPSTTLGVRHDTEVALDRRKRQLYRLWVAIVIANLLACGGYARVFLNISKDEVAHFPSSPPYLASTWAAALIFLAVTLCLSVAFFRKYTHLKADIEH
jgi:hypothetical protein